MLAAQGDGEARTKMFNLKVTCEELKLLRRRSARKRVPMSEIARTERLDEAIADERAHLVEEMAEGRELDD